MGRRIAASALKPLVCIAALVSLISLAPRPAAAAMLKWRSVPKDNFVAKFTQFTPADKVDKVLTLFVESKKKQEKYFNKKLEFRVEVVIYPATGDFTSATGEPWWHGAVRRDGRIHIQPPDVLAERGILATTIDHEYAHIALEKAAGQNVPLWFDEGFAAWSSGEYDADFKSKPADFFWNGTIAELEKAISQTKDKALALRAYRACYRLVRMMNEQFSAKSMQALYMESAKKSDFAKAMKKVLNTDADSLIKKIRGGKKKSK